MSDGDQGLQSVGAKVVNIPPGRPAKAVFALVTSIVAFAIALIAGYFIIVLSVDNRKLNKRIDDIETSQLVLKSELGFSHGQRIDLTTSTFQNLHSNFAVSIASVDSHLTGVTIEGTLLNQNSTETRDVKCRVTVGNSSQDLSIPVVYSGYAAQFQVYVPDVDAKDTKEADFVFQNANVSYHMQK